MTMPYADSILSSSSRIILFHFRLTILYECQEIDTILSRRMNQGVMSSIEDKYELPNPSILTDSSLLKKDNEKRMSTRYDTLPIREIWLLRILCIFLVSSCMVLAYYQLSSDKNLESKCFELHSVPCMYYLTRYS